MKDWLLGRDEGRISAALAILNALLVDAEVNFVEDIWDDGAGVFEADGDVVLLCSVGEEAYEADRIRLSQAKAVLCI